MISTQGLPEERRVRAGEPRLRAVVPRAHGLRAGTDRRARSGSSRSSSAAPSTASTSSCRSARRTTTARGRASPSRGRDRRATGAIDLDGFFGFNPRLAAAQAAVGHRRAGHRPRVRIARRDALALRRAGLHGNGDARRQEHARWLAEPVPAGQQGRGGRGGDAVPRRSADAAAAAHAAGRARPRWP